MDRDPFQEYLKHTEPDKASKGYAWSTAIGLQAVDGLKPSQYLIDTAIQNIEGKITIKEAQGLIDSYYNDKPMPADENRTEEADKVIYSHAGTLRDYNITKREWVLDGDTVTYGSALELRETLEYDFSREREFNYRGLTMDQIIHHLALFVSNLWQIHVFAEGNTRTTAVFFIKYLRILGFSATNDIFAHNAWYFRNSLVRANYTNLQKGIHETTEYLELFLRNLLLGENNELHNRVMHISGYWMNEKPDIEPRKTDVQRGKPDIQDEKPYIEEIFAQKGTGLSSKARIHAYRLFAIYGFDGIFGRGIAAEQLGIKNSAASSLVSNLLKVDIIEPVAGHGKGRYKFKKS